VSAPSGVPSWMRAWSAESAVSSASPSGRARMKSGMDSSSASLASYEGAAGPAVAMVDRAGVVDFSV
jgi:hypothetical protein